MAKAFSMLVKSFMALWLDDRSMVLPLYDAFRARLIYRWR